MRLHGQLASRFLCVSNWLKLLFEFLIFKHQGGERCFKFHHSTLANLRRKPTLPLLAPAVGACFECGGNATPIDASEPVWSQDASVRIPTTAIRANHTHLRGSHLILRDIHCFFGGVSGLCLDDKAGEVSNECECLLF